MTIQEITKLSNEQLLQHIESLNSIIEQNESALIELSENIKSAEILKKIPTPVQSMDELVPHTTYYIVNIYSPSGYDDVPAGMQYSPHMKEYVDKKILHHTSQNAIAHTKALIELNGGIFDE